MKQFWIQVIALLVITIVSLLVTFNGSIFGAPTTFLTRTNSTSTDTSQGQVTGVSQVKINDTVINVEIADTQPKRAQGLSNRNSLDPNSGMLFLFDSPSRYQFWMKDTKIPLDMIWINGDKVADILNNVPVPAPNQPVNTLPIYEPAVPVDKVLEVNGGFAAAHGIKVGDSVSIIQ